MIENGHKELASFTRKWRQKLEMPQSHMNAFPGEGNETSNRSYYESEANEKDAETSKDYRSDKPMKRTTQWS